MNNRDIEEVITSYNNFRYDIDAIFFDSALEADTVTSVDDDANKVGIGQKLMDTVKKLIKQLQSMIERAFLKLSNGIVRVLQTNDGFDKKCRERMMKVKPLEAVKLIAYQYNETFLDNQMNKLQQAVIKIIANTKTSYTDIRDGASDSLTDSSKGEVISTLLKSIGVPSDTTDIGTYFIYLKKGFRNEKKEQLFTASMSRQYYQTTHSYDKLKTSINSRQGVLNQQVNIIKSNLENLVKNGRVADDVKRKAIAKSKAVGQLLNFYTASLSIYTQLKLERILSYRQVLKKLYQF